jgi:hypothetical protein
VLSRRIILHLTCVWIEGMNHSECMCRLYLRDFVCSPQEENRSFRNVVHSVVCVCVCVVRAMVKVLLLTCDVQRGRLNPVPMSKF